MESPLAGDELDIRARMFAPLAADAVTNPFYSREDRLIDAAGRSSGTADPNQLWQRGRGLSGLRPPLILRAPVPPL